MSASSALLRFVDEERARRVHRPERDLPFADRERPHELHDAIGQIEDLDAIARGDDEVFSVNDEAAGAGRGDVGDGALAQGHRGPLAHQINLLIFPA